MTTRYVAVTVFGVMLAASRIAAAEDATGTALEDGGTLTFSELKIHEDDSATAEFPKVDPDSKWHYFNIAHCQCAAPNVTARSDYNEKTFQYLLKAVNAPTSEATIELWTGSDCQTMLSRPTSCYDTMIASTATELRNALDKRVDISVFDLMSPTKRTADGCVGTTSSTTNGTLYMLADTNKNTTPDYAATEQIITDKGPPPLPTDFRVIGTESGIKLSWTVPDDPTDIYRYQALCTDDTDQPLGNGATPLYDTASNLCGADIKFNLTPTEIPGVDDDTVDASAGVTLPDGMLALDPKYICGTENNSASSGFTINGLQNGKPYKIALLVIDKFGNATGTYFTRAVAPVPSTDFWEDLHKRNAGVEGGLCLLAETYGDDSSLTGALRSFRDDTLGGSGAGRWLSDAYYATLGKAGGLVHGSVVRRVIAGVLLAPVVALALAWHWLTLPGVLLMFVGAWLWRRHRLRWLARTAPVGAMAAALLAPGLARAGGYQPYWENPDVVGDKPEVAFDDPSLVTWHVGVRVGPYIPEIDSKLKKLGQPGPYKQMFGDRFHILVMLDVDRVVWSGYGQLAVGASAGYWQKRARAFADGSSATDGDRERANDENTLRMVPTQLSATYRLTVLDDDYGIPVVPYVRGGLSYYLWSLTTANGSFASVCKDKAMDGDPMCAKDKAYGGSLGVHGAIGLAIRAERIDASTATSMRQSGILHAGIYGELSVAKVDGFGADAKLSLGDKTWFGGVNFEF